MNQQERAHKYGSLRGETIVDGESPPPTYVEATSWSVPKIIAVVGFILLQVVLVVSILNQIISDRLADKIEPEQIHLSLGENDAEFYVSWATARPANCHLVWYKNGSSFSKSVRGQRLEALFEEGPEDTKRLFNNVITKSEKTFSKYFYHAKMTVSPGDTYFYYITSSTVDYGEHFSNGKRTTYLSERFHFRALPYDDISRPLQLLFYGDLGLLNGQSIPRLTNEAASYSNDLIIHNGDFAYDLDTMRGEYGDKFMRLIEPIAARLPYQTSVGNHEVARNFSFYDKRFFMLNRGPINHGQINNFYYSFNAGPIHFIAISTEFYYFLDYSGLAPLVNQYEWLESDLKAASKTEARKKRPWIVVYGHRPMYCSSRDNDDCSKDTNLLRRGLPFTGAYALEKLFYDYGVDLELYSHEHQYERFLPIYEGQVYNGTDKIGDPYHNPRAPVHLISGSAGCQERLDPFQGHPVTGSVKQISDYGFTKIYATRCKIHLSQVSDDRAGTSVDSFILSKNRQNFPPNSPAINYDECQ